jgi:hypothetical protein
MGPVFVTSLLTLPSLALLLIPFHDASSVVDTRNSLVGFRTRETLSSREAWDAAHAWIRRPLKLLAGVLAAVTVVSVISDIAFTLPGALEIAIIATQLTLFISGVLLIGRRANRVAAEVNRQAASADVAD